MKNSVKYNNILISKIDDIENSMTSFRAELDKIKSTKVVTNESLKKIDELDNKISKQINKLDKYRNQVTKIVCGIVDANKENTEFKESVEFDEIAEIKFDTTVGNFPVKGSVVRLPKEYVNDVIVKDGEFELRKGSIIYIGKKYRKGYEECFRKICIKHKSYNILTKTIIFNSEKQLLQFILGRDLRETDKIYIDINGRTVEEYSRKGYIK